MRFLALALLPLTCQLQLAAAQSFVDVTPPGVAINRGVSLDPRDPSHVLVESATLFESFDGGDTWSNLATLPGNVGCFDGNGDLVFASLGAPMSAGQSLQRRTAAGLEVIPVPSVAPGDPEQFIFGVIGHPTSSDSLAIQTFADDLNTGDYLVRVFVTVNGGASWDLVVLAVSDGNSYQNLSGVEFVPTETGSGLLVTWTYQDLRFSAAEVILWGLDSMGQTTTEVSVTEASCGVAASRTLPGRRYAFESSGPAWMPGPRAILRREPMGTYMPAGDQGSFRDVAAGKVDQDLVLRLEYLDSRISLSVSRDGAQSWSSLLDPVATGYALKEVFGLTSTDGHVFLRATETALNERRLLRVPVESLIGSPECPGVVNSTGRPGALVAVGRAEASANRYLLSIRDLPSGSFYLPIAGRDAGLVVNPGGSSGNLCLGGHVGRLVYALAPATPWGEASAEINLTALPGPAGSVAASQGETWRFQVWYRDVTGTGVSNFTNSIVTTFD